MFKPQLSKNTEVYIDNMVVKSKVESERVNDHENIFESINYALMLPSALLVLVWASFLVIWSLIVELNSTLIRSRLLTICSLLGIPRKSRS